MSVANQWRGTIANRARKYMAACLAVAGQLDCYRCGKPVKATDKWDVEHKESLIDGGSLTDPSNWGISHASCNRSHGAELGNQRRSNTAKRLRDWT